MENNMDTTLKLLTPVVVEDETVSELTLRELSVDELLAQEKTHGSKSILEQDIHSYALMTGYSPKVIRALKQRDWMRLRNLFWSTLGNVSDDQEEATSD
jgi:hypothetical protein